MRFGADVLGKSLAGLALLALAPSCATVDLDAERQALLALHEVDRQAHVDTMVAPLMTSIGEELISVFDGRVTVQGRDEIETFFRSYFDGASYSEYADLDQPIVRISRDGTMAWMITRQRIRRTEPDTTGGVRERSFDYAGIMTYEKRDGSWIKVANVSTFERLIAAPQ